MVPTSSRMSLTGWEAGGTKFVLTRNLVVRGNFVHHNVGPALWTDEGNVNTLYEGNLVEDNRDSGIFHEISHSAVIRNNTLRRNGATAGNSFTSACILVASSNDVEVYGNVVEDCRFGIHGSQQNRGPNQLERLWVHDNTIRRAGEMFAGVVRDYGDSNQFFSRSLRFDRNRYEGTASQYPFAWQNGARTWDYWRSVGHDPSSTFID